MHQVCFADNRPHVPGLIFAMSMCETRIVNYFLVLSKFSFQLAERGAAFRPSESRAGLTAHRRGSEAEIGCSAWLGMLYIHVDLPSTKLNLWNEKRMKRHQHHKR